MVEELLVPFNSILYGFGAFIVSFIVLSILWSLFLRVTSSFFSKSKLYFIPNTLKETSRSIFVVIFLISLYFGVSLFDPNLVSPDGALVKVWGVIIILLITEVVSKIILNIMDNYYVKLRKSPTFISNAVPILKRIIGVLVYGIAVLVIINYLSSEVGSIVAGIGFVVLALLFILYYEQLKNILAGLQLIGEHVREGDYVEVKGHKGFVEKIQQQFTMIRDLDGKTAVIPNIIFLKEIVSDCCFSDGNLITLDVELKTPLKNLDKTVKRLSAISSKTALELEQVMNDYKPKVHVSEILDGKPNFVVKFIIYPNSDLRKIIDTFSKNIVKEFKDKVSFVGLE